MLIFLKSVGGFIENEDGPTAVEYGVMLALVVVASVTIVTSLGGTVSGMFNSVSTAVGS